MRLRLSASDYFHRLVDRMIRRDGGPGNLGQLVVRLDAPPADGGAALARAWRAAGEDAWILGARVGEGLRGAWWTVDGPARLDLETSRARAEAVAGAHLGAGLAAEEGRLVRLALAGDPADPGVVLTWNHQLCDARGAQGLLAALPRLAAGRRLAERWWEGGYRADAELPATAAERGRQARAAVELLKPLRRRPVLRATGGGRNRARPLATAHRALGEDATALVDARQRAATGRFAENPFLLAAVAATLEESCGVGGDLVFPFAVDHRQHADERLLANQHGFLMLGLAGGQATADLGEAARALKASHRTWVGAGGTGKLLSAISWFPWAGGWFPRYQLGFGRSGLAASCVVGNAGRCALPARWFGCGVRGVDHAVTVPGNPGLAVLFHRDARGLGFDVVVGGALAGRLAPHAFADRLIAVLVGRPFSGAP